MSDSKFPQNHSDTSDIRPQDWSDQHAGEWIDQLYQDAYDEQPDAALDAQILAAARHATQAQASRPSPRIRRWVGWGVPLAGAAVMLLSITMLMQVPSQDLQPVDSIEIETTTAAKETARGQPATVSSDSTLLSPAPDVISHADDIATPAPVVALPAPGADPATPEMEASGASAPTAGSMYAPKLARRERMASLTAEADMSEQAYAPQATYSLSESHCQDEGCQRMIKHQACVSDWFLPEDAEQVEIELEAVVFVSANRLHQVRCLDGNWIVQSHALQPPPSD